MSMYIINPRAGDKLSRPKGAFTHTGIYVGYGRVFHSTPERGPHISTFDQFAAGKLVTVHPANNADRTAILIRVRAELERQQKYDLIFNNCQHTSSKAAVGQAASEDLQAIAWISVMLMLIFLAARKQ
jgi:hypothetical protein